MTLNQAYKAYPSQDEIIDWIEDIWKLAAVIPVSVEMLPDNGIRNNYGSFHTSEITHLIKFSPKGMKSFYGSWQPVLNGPAPLVMHVPGYGAELSCHPETVAQGYSLLCISPLGYWTPDGMNTSLLSDGNWPVLPDTIRTGAAGGYKTWLLNCVMAAKWAWKQPQVIPDRISFYGTSQGGGGSLLLGSLFADRGVRCVAADVPFLTDYPRANWRGAYGVAKKAFDESTDPDEAWHSLGFADTMSHAFRMQYPVLLTEGGADDVCPPDTIDQLYDRLPYTKSKTFLANKGHGYTMEFMHLVQAWLRLYA